ncbi:hypothetical protein [Numidum massiliense]|uniref:hypothetical protein n=1 Tax=Numidum massiliense TaxID=1522315 RepID=UPI0006D52B11|nr:hypothetical protein [Numidum massiliense]
MAINLDYDTQLEAVNDVIELLDKRECILFVKLLQVNVHGFSAKNISKAPPSLLKKFMKQKLKRKPPTFIIEQLATAGHLDQYDRLTVEQFLLQAGLDSALSPARRLSMLVLKYPDFYEQHREAITKNIAEEMDPFTGLLSETPPLAVKLTTLLDLHEEIADELMAGIANKYPLPPVTDTVQQADAQRALTDRLADQLPDPLTGAYIHLVCMYRDDWTEWEAGDQLPLVKLALLDALALYKAACDHLERMSKLQDDLKRETETLNRALQKEKDNYLQRQKRVRQQETKANELVKKQELANEQLTRANRELTEANEELQRANDMLKCKKEELQLANDGVVRTNEQLEQKLAALEQVVAQQEEQLQRERDKQLGERDRMQVDPKQLQQMALFADRQFYFLSCRDDPLYRLLFTEEQYISLEDLVGMQNFINTLEEKGDSRFLFIDTDSLSTKDMFALEEGLNRSYQFVSGGAARIVNTINYCLEGDA